MNAGRIIITLILALALAIGASSTASARSSYSFGFNPGAPAWVGGYCGYAPYYYAPSPVVAYPYPSPYYGGSDFSLGYSSR